MKIKPSPVDDRIQHYFYIFCFKVGITADLSGDLLVIQSGGELEMLWSR